MSSLYIDWEVLYSYNSLHYQVTKTYILTFCLVHKDTLRASQLYIRILQTFKLYQTMKFLSEVAYYIIEIVSSDPRIHTRKYKVLVFLLLLSDVNCLGNH